MSGAGRRTQRANAERTRAERAARGETPSSEPFAVEPGISAGIHARALTSRHAELVSQTTAVLAELEAASASVTAWAEAFFTRRVREVLSEVDAARLGEMTERNLRLSAVQAGGFLTAADLLGVSAAELAALPGVGEATARGVVAAVAQLADTTAALEPLRIEVPRGSLPRPEGAEELLARLHRVMRLRQVLGPHREELERYATAAHAALPVARRARWRARMWLSSSAARRETNAALEVLRARDHPELAATLRSLEDTIERLAAPGVAALIADFERRSADYYVTLASLSAYVEASIAGHGMFAPERIEEIEARELDGSALRVALRGYQAFGARFALVAERVVLGDEMGLGKTIQALAVLCDLTARGAERFLVVCPASLLSNWEREIEHRTTLRPRRIHGADREAQRERWLADGGVGLTTYEGLQQLDPAESGGITALVVDEAHYAKNPRTQRAQAVARWAEATPRVLLMTGTPLSNRIDDFLALVQIVRPALAGEFPRHLGLLDAAAFRRAVAPVYLRRNQEEVLIELPDIVATDEWVQLTSADERAYREAVASGSLMSMRRAAWAAEDSAKLDRLVEIVDEARYEGRGTVVFSFFRDVLDRIAQNLRAQSGSRVFGPLDGDVPVPERQAMVDAFSADADGAVLLAQITVGGTGLNLQAASVVVLCEPQLTPASEEQAIARLHRMGQVHAVSAHRLLAEGGVDEGIVALLRDKQRIFDDYVRTSSVATLTDAAVDVTSRDLARDLVAWEQARHGYGAVWDGLESPEERGTTRPG